MAAAATSATTFFDFGEGAESAKGDLITGIAGEGDSEAHDLCRCNAPGMMSGQALLSLAMPQREWLNPTEPQVTRNAATVANIPKLRDELRRHLVEAPCMVVHYGSFRDDFESLMAFGRETMAGSGGKIPVMFCAAGATGKDVILPETIPETILRGVSIFCNAIDLAGFAKLGVQFGRCATLAREKRIDISPIRFIAVIDRTAGYVLSQAIRDDSDDRLFIVDDDSGRSSEGEHRFELATKYFSQVETMQEPAPTLMSKDWETIMSVHAFRNAHYPAVAIETAKFPLDQLGFLLAFHPFGLSYCIADTLLPEKGPLVKKLLEAWCSTILGTAVRFIHAE